VGKWAIDEGKITIEFPATFFCQPNQREVSVRNNLVIVVGTVILSYLLISPFADRAVG
jgi:hypothetical protein